MRRSRYCWPHPPAGGCRPKREIKQAPLPNLQRDTLHVLRAPYAAGWEAIVAAVTDAAVVLGELERRGIITTGSR